MHSDLAVARKVARGELESNVRGRNLTPEERKVFFDAAQMLEEPSRTLFIEAFGLDGEAPLLFTEMAKDHDLSVYQVRRYVETAQRDVECILKGIPIPAEGDRSSRAKQGRPRPNELKRLKLFNAMTWMPPHFAEVFDLYYGIQKIGVRTIESVARDLDLEVSYAQLLLDSAHGYMQRYPEIQEKPSGIVGHYGVIPRTDEVEGLRFLLGFVDYADRPLIEAQFGLVGQPATTARQFALANGVAVSEVKQRSKVAVARMQQEGTRPWQETVDQTYRRLKIEIDDEPISTLTILDRLGAIDPLPDDPHAGHPLVRHLKSFRNEPNSIDRVARSAGRPLDEVEVELGALQRGLSRRLLDATYEVAREVCVRSGPEL